MIRNLKTLQIQFKDKLSRNVFADITLGSQASYDVPSKLLTIETKEVLIEIQMSSDEIKRLIATLRESLAWEGCG